MYRTALLSLLVAAAGPSFAQDLTGPEAATLPRILDSLCIDLIADEIGCEQVLLLASETEPDWADLVILGDWRADPPSPPRLVARAVAFNGHLWGAAPWLEQAENGSLRLHSERIGWGRFPWHQVLTIAYRDDVFRVVGYTYTLRDRGTAGGMHCDLNLLTGDFTAFAETHDPATEQNTVVLDETGRMDPVFLSLSDWPLDRSEFPPCRAASEAFRQQ